MKFEKIKLVYVNVEYLKDISNIDSEVYFDENKNYEEKPHVGVLINNNGNEYLIPLTSAKKKHKNWKDRGSGCFRIYEIIDTRTDDIKEKDIIVDIKNNDVLSKIKEEDIGYYKQRILSVLDTRKMIPVKKGLYHNADLNISTYLATAERQRRQLMMKEYFFIQNIKTDIERLAKSIYEKQMKTGKVLKYHCNYKKLEEFLATYQRDL